MSYNSELWEKIMEIGRMAEPEREGIANKLSDWDVQTIVGVMDYFGASNVWIHQTLFDLGIVRYRVFDWLGMCIMSRNDDDREGNEIALKVLVYAYVEAGGKARKFVENLRYTDYEVEDGWKSVEVY